MLLKRLCYRIGDHRGAKEMKNAGITIKGSCWTFEKQLFAVDQTAACSRTSASNSIRPPLFKRY
jgi:hypothetical protein